MLSPKGFWLPEAPPPLREASSAEPKGFCGPSLNAKPKKPERVKANKGDVRKLIFIFAVFRRLAVMR